MRVIVLSDTHIPKRAKELPSELVRELKQADLIIHAGDWQTIEVLDMLRPYGPIEGVYGNVDSEHIKQQFPDKKLLEIKGFKIGVVHGHGQKQTTEKRALAAFSEESLDLLIFGHSHIPVKKQIGGMWVFNPGSPTDKRRQPSFSFGILEITDTLEINHLYFK